MIELTDKSKCSGCHACAEICPQNCIEMKFDSEGFLYPEISKNSCVNCGLCDNVCQTINPLKSENSMTAYVAYSKNEDIQLASSSGGIFTLLAYAILEEGGVVFGAAFDESKKVRHIYIENKKDITLLQGSKYLQSIIGNSYRKVEEFLKNGRKVLFTGTPCQIDGLKQYLRKNYPNLYTQDIVCHGVPSPMVWIKYVKYCEKKLKSKIKKVDFRNKRFGWKMYSVQIIAENRNEYSKKYNKDLYMMSFLKNLCLRPSCYSCNSKTLNRNSDITLADFWGVENVDSEMFNNKGTSLVLINSKKGKWLLDCIEGKLVIRAVNVNEALRYNSAVYKSAEKPNNRTRFFDDIEKVNFKKAVKKNVETDLWKKIRTKVKYEIKKLHQK